MTHVFKELIKKADAVFQLVEAKDTSALSASCCAFKDEFLGHIPAIKKVIVSWVENRQRKKARDLRYEVKDTRVSLERSIRSRLLVNTTDLSGAREDLIVAAKKMIKIERLLAFVDDMLFAGDIASSMDEAIDFAKAAVAETQAAAEAMAQAAKTKRLEQDYDHDRSLQTRLGN